MVSLLCDKLTRGRTGLYLVPALVAGALLTGCGGEKTTASQVAARVNSQDITINEVNYALSHMQSTPGLAPEKKRDEVLGNLIVQKLADQKAIKMKLDQKPEVIEAIENARNTILARAYMDPIVSNIPKPTEQEIHKFYVDHPELFSDRRVYNLQELLVKSKPGLSASIRDRITGGEGMEALAAWLKDQKAEMSMHAETKPAEDLPSVVLQRLYKLPAGKLMVVETNNAIWVVQAKAAKVAAVEESKAKPIIQAYLANKRKKETLDKEVAALKAGAKIKYANGFGARPAVAEKTKPAAAGKPATAKTDMAKGVAGL